MSQASLQLVCDLSQTSYDSWRPSLRPGFRLDRQVKFEL